MRGIGASIVAIAVAATALPGVKGADDDAPSSERRLLGRSEEHPVQRRRDIWVIEVRKRDGSTQVIEQDYPALFQVGDQVVVEGDRVRAPE